jgi:hypothetical protein
MSLALNGQIKSEDIFAIERLDPNRDVYLLVGAVDKIVLKLDVATTHAKQFNVLQAARNMKAINPVVATKNVTVFEVMEVHSFVKEEMRDTRGPLDPAHEAFDKVVSTGNTVGWVKTNFFEGLVNLESAAAKARQKNRDKSGIRAIAAALSAPGGLEKFGEILVIDAFNGNNDRFDMSEPPQGNKGCIRMVNDGNVAVCMQNGVMQPVGMDPYSMSNSLGDVTQKGMPGARPGLPPDDWTGYRLKDDQRAWRMRFCEDVAADLEHMLGPRDRVLKIMSTNRLPKNAAQRLALGMDQGIVRFKAKLLAIDQRRAPPRLISAIVALGWAKPAPPPGLPPRR